VGVAVFALEAVDGMPGRVEDAAAAATSIVVFGLTEVIAYVELPERAEALFPLFNTYQQCTCDALHTAQSYLEFWTANAPPTLPPIVPPTKTSASTNDIQNRRRRIPRIVEASAAVSSLSPLWTISVLVGKGDGDGDDQSY
jgi:hypothetical protein